MILVQNIFIKSFLHINSNLELKFIGKKVEKIFEITIEKKKLIIIIKYKDKNYMLFYKTKI